MQRTNRLFGILLIRSNCHERMRENIARDKYFTMTIEYILKNTSRTDQTKIM